MRLTFDPILLWLSLFAASALAVNPNVTCQTISHAMSGASLVSFPGVQRF